MPVTTPLVVGGAAEAVKEAEVGPAKEFADDQAGQATSTSAPVLSPEDELQAKREKKDVERGRAIEELVASERRYIRILEAIDRIGNTLSCSTHMSKAAIDNLFRTNTNGLCVTNGKLLDDLDCTLYGFKVESSTLHQDWKDDAFQREDSEAMLRLRGANVGDIILRHVTGLKTMYVVYSNSYDEVSTELQRLVGSDGHSDFGKVLREALEDEGVAGDFQGLLIQPIQRIPRYPLLLSRILELSPPDHPDHAPLQRAVDQVMDVAQHLNESLRRREEELRVLDLQKCFFPPFRLVAPGRRLLYQGELTKLAAMPSSSLKERKRHTFFLFNDSIAYGQQIFAGFYQARRLLKLKGWDAGTGPNIGTLRFKIMADPKDLIVEAKNQQEKQAWLRMIKLALEDQQNSPAPSQPPARTPPKRNSLTSLLSTSRF